MPGRLRARADVESGSRRRPPGDLCADGAVHAGPVARVRPRVDVDARCQPVARPPGDRSAGSGLALAGETLGPAHVALPGDRSRAVVAADRVLGTGRCPFVPDAWKQPHAAEAQPAHGDAGLSRPGVVAHEPVRQAPQRGVGEVPRRASSHPAAQVLEAAAAGDPVPAGDDLEDPDRIAVPVVVGCEQVAGQVVPGVHGQVERCDHGRQRQPGRGAPGPPEQRLAAVLERARRLEAAGLRAEVVEDPRIQRDQLERTRRPRRSDDVEGIGEGLLARSRDVASLVIEPRQEGDHGNVEQQELRDPRRPRRRALGARGPCRRDRLVDGRRREHRSRERQVRVPRHGVGRVDRRDDRDGIGRLRAGRRGEQDREERGAGGAARHPACALRSRTCSAVRPKIGGVCTPIIRSIR